MSGLLAFRGAVAEVRARVDIVALIGATVSLRKAGKDLKALCPFHDERTPSFWVVPTKRIFVCFGCGEHGDVFDWVMRQRGIGFADAVRLLGREHGVPVPGNEPTRDYDPAALARAWAEHRRADTQRRANDRRARAQATAAARAFYAACDPLRDGHAYLESHGLDMTGCAGIRIDRDGWLVVPMFRNGRLSSVQRISPAGEKRYWPGAPAQDTSFVVERKGATVTVLCEGLATGLACFAALPTCRVIVCFDAGNLARTKARPVGLVVIAADNDHATEERTGKNPGREAAATAARAIGCGVALPVGINGTDFADMRAELYVARKARAGKYDTRATLQKAVDAQIAQALMREARFVAR